MAEDGLRDSQGNYDHSQNEIDKKEAPQFRLGIEQRIAHKEQWDVVEEKLHAENAIHQARRRGIENLHHTEPDEKGEPVRGREAGTRKPLCDDRPR